MLQVPVYGHVQCGGCSIMLMYPLGAQSVKCSVCHYVTHVSQQANWGPSSSGGQGQPAAQPKTQTVVVENPPSLDEQGNEVSSLAWVPAGSSSGACLPQGQLSSHLLNPACQTLCLAGDKKLCVAGHGPVTSWWQQE